MSSDGCAGSKYDFSKTLTLKGVPGSDVIGWWSRTAGQSALRIKGALRIRMAGATHQIVSPTFLRKMNDSLSESMSCIPLPWLLDAGHCQQHANRSLPQTAGVSTRVPLGLGVSAAVNSPF